MHVSGRTLSSECCVRLSIICYDRRCTETPTLIKRKQLVGLDSRCSILGTPPLFKLESLLGGPIDRSVLERKYGSETGDAADMNGEGSFVYLEAEWSERISMDVPYRSVVTNRRTI